MAKIVSKETVARKQLNRLPVAGQDTREMLPKSPSSVSISLEGVYTIRPARAGLPRTWQHVQDTMGVS